jgi:hypothetical protein
VTAGIHGHDAKAGAQCTRDLRPRPLAEAVGVMEERERALAAPVEQRGLDAALRQRDCPPGRVGQQGAGKRF